MKTTAATLWHSNASM